MADIALCSDPGLGDIYSRCRRNPVNTEPSEWKQSYVMPDRDRFRCRTAWPLAMSLCFAGEMMEDCCDGTFVCV